MELQYLVLSNEVLESLERIEDQMIKKHKALSSAGLHMVNDIITEYCALVPSISDSGDIAMQEYKKISAEILRKSLAIRQRSENLANQGFYALSA